MPLSPLRLAFLYPSLRLFHPHTATIVAARRYRHGTAVEPTPTPTDTTAAVKEEIQTTATEAVKDVTAGVVEKDKEKGEDKEKEKPPPPPPPPPSSPPSPISIPPKQQQYQVPNLAPGEWVHHFDTYSLAKSLERSGFRNGQSVAIMKGIRGLLAENLEFAKENLVSKSNVENESYLFHAACSELRNEIQYTRKTQIDNLRADGAAIQQEYDLLNHKFLEDMMSLKDELNGLFNDRKMVTRAEQRAMENKIQELNYKITVLINSDLRSEIEKLRWTTTRRGLIAIVALAIFVVTSIRLSKNGHDDKKDKKKKDKGDVDDTHDFENRLLPADGLAESLANSGSRSSGASFVSLG